jgi:group I intron endonuclease
MAHVYLITNKITGKKYIGVTHHSDVNKRFDTHKYGRIRLSSSIKKYGSENFTIESIKECRCIEEAFSLEPLYIKEYDTLHPNGYNFSSGGKGSKEGHGNSMPTSEETKRKISLAKKGQYWGAKLTKEELKEEYSKRAASRIGQKRDSYNKGMFKGKIWINKDNKVKRINENELNTWLDEGWARGYITNRDYTKSTHSKKR